MQRLFIIGEGDAELTGVGVQAKNLVQHFLADKRLDTQFFSFSESQQVLERNRDGHFKLQDILLVLNGVEILEALRDCPAYKICYTYWEATKIPDTWQYQLSFTDEVWALTPWGSDIMQQNGIAANKLFVVPGGVEPDTFCVDGSTLSFINLLHGYKFLTVGKAEARKSTAEILFAFDIAFEPDDPVYLIAAIHNSMIPGFDSARFLDSLCLRNRAKIIPIYPLSQRHTIAALYRSCDSFIYPSKAEGFGLPGLEAMSCGLPIAATHYSGQAHYLEYGSAIEIPFTIKKIPPLSIPFFERADCDYGNWAVSDPLDIAKAFQYLHQNHTELKRNACKSAAIIAQHFSWKTAYKIARKHISRISLKLEKRNA